MTAILVSVADAIAEELAEVTLSEEFSVDRSYADWDDDLQENQKGVLVDVVPASCSSTLLSRGKLAYVCTVNVLLRKRLNQIDRDRDGKFRNEVIDALVEDLQTINEYFAPSQPDQTGRRLTAMATARWTEQSGIKAPYSRKMLRDHSQFSGWVGLVYSVPRAPGA